MKTLICPLSNEAVTEKECRKCEHCMGIMKWGVWCEIKAKEAK